jgi:hypothetical protein
MDLVENKKKAADILAARNSRRDQRVADRAGLSLERARELGLHTMWNGDEDVLLSLFADHEHETSQIMRANS